MTIYSFEGQFCSTLFHLEVITVCVYNCCGITAPYCNRFMILDYVFIYFKGEYWLYEDTRCCKKSCQSLFLIRGEEILLHSFNLLQLILNEICLYCGAQSGVCFRSKSYSDMWINLVYGLGIS